MPFASTFRYPRVSRGTSTGPAIDVCADDYGTTVGISNGGGFTPQPFTAVQLLRPANGMTTPTGRNVDASPQLIVAPAGWPRFVKGLIVPGLPGNATCGIYALFGQAP